MFTGIIERMARVQDLEDPPGRRIITVEVTPDGESQPWRPAVLGESVAVNGACLTVVRVSSRGSTAAVSFDAVPETLSKTTLGSLKRGEFVNLERSLRVGDALGGHYVTGHIDGVGRVRSRRSEGDQVLFEVEAPDAIVGQILPKGSIAVDGVSLTVVDVRPESRCFRFAVIPHTLRWTVLAHRDAGSSVNLESDAFGKWVLHAVGHLLGDRAGSAEARLRDLLESQGGVPGRNRAP